MRYLVTSNRVEGHKPGDVIDLPVDQGRPLHLAGHVIPEPKTPKKPAAKKGDA